MREALLREPSAPSEKPGSSIPQAMHAAYGLEGKREAFQRAGVWVRRGGENLLALQDQSRPLALKIIRREKCVSGQTICCGSQCPVFSVFSVSDSVCLSLWAAPLFPPTSLPSHILSADALCSQ